MSRTLSGKLTGKAAVLEARDMREYLNDMAREERKRIRDESRKMADEIWRMLSQEEFAEWYDSTPDDNAGYYQTCKEKLSELRKELYKLLFQPLSEQVRAEIEKDKQWLDLPHQPNEFTQTAEYVDVRTKPALNAGVRFEKVNATIDKVDERTIHTLNGWEVKTVIEKRDASGNFPAIQKAIDMGALDPNGNILPYKSCGSVGKSWDNHEIHSWKLE